MPNLRRSWRFVLRLLFLLVFALCETSCAGRGLYTPPSDIPSYPPQKYPTGPDPNELIWEKDRAKTCSALSWLAIATDENGDPPAKCPPAMGWETKDLFPPGAGTGKARFCIYDWLNPYSTEGAQDGPTIAPEHGRLRGKVRRCAVVAPLGLSELSAEPFFREFRYQTGTTELLLFDEQPPQVRLAILDTQPTKESPLLETCGTDCTPHGFAMAHIARNLTCQEPVCAEDKNGHCAAEVATHLTLPLRLEGETLVEDGEKGYFGRPSDLAKAIAREVSDWSQQKQPRHLILNLSLGWDPELLRELASVSAAGSPTGNLDQVNLEEEAVYDALLYAQNEGVLVIAAAGNSPGGARPGQLATLPARWYAIPPDAFGRLSVSERPVVYAVGAVDRNDRPLANVRVDSLPPFAAYGDHAVVPLPSGGWTTPMTGSSVAAVVTSSLAAVAWHLRPDLDAAGVMDLLYRSGDPLGRMAELDRSASSGLTGSPGTGVRRLRLNTLLSRIRTLPEVTPPNSDFTPPELDCRVALPPTSLSCPDWPAGQPLLVCAPGGVPQALPPCPPTLLPSVASVPWVLTQPTSPPCDSCALGSGGPGGGRMADPEPVSPPDVPNDSNATPRRAQAADGIGAATPFLDLEIPSQWTKSCVSDMVLEVQVPGDATTRRLWLVPPGGQLCQDASLRVWLPFASDEGTASVTFRLADSPYSVRAPLYVHWKP